MGGVPGVGECVVAEGHGNGEEISGLVAHVTCSIGDRKKWLSTVPSLSHTVALTGLEVFGRDSSPVFGFTPTPTPCG